MSPLLSLLAGVLTMLTFVALMGAVVVVALKIIPPRAESYVDEYERELLEGDQ